MTDSLPSLTVVMPVYNEEADIRETLRSLWRASMEVTPRPRWCW